MFKNAKEFEQYIEQSFPEVTDSRVNLSHWDLPCTHCKVTRGFQVVRLIVAAKKTQYSPGFQEMFDGAYTYIFRCPVCKAFKQWIIYKVTRQDINTSVTRYYRIASVPSEGLDEIAELPTEPPSLRVAYREAVRCMDANAPLAAAAMFRRALQIITRNLLGAKPGNLANELKEVVGKEFNGSIIRGSFTTNSYIVKEAGNQGAHPDQDPDLISFTMQDAQDLQLVFMEIVNDLFVEPAAKAKSRAEFLARRKINPR